MKKSILLVNFFFILISIISIVVLFSTYKTFSALSNLENKQIKSSDEFDKQFSYFPNITPASIPVDALRGAIYLADGKSIDAKNYLTKASLINPHIGYSDYILANWYYFKGNIDSSYFYANRAFKLWPKSLDNFTMLNKVFANQGDTLNIINTYIQVKDFFKHRPEYYNTFIEHYGYAKYAYFNVTYDDLISISDSDLIGKWYKVIDKRDGGAIMDTTQTISFLRNKNFLSNNDSFLYRKINDTVLLSRISNPKYVLTKFSLSYSPKRKTLLVKSSANSMLSTRYFKKAE